MLISLCDMKSHPSQSQSSYRSIFPLFLAVSKDNRCRKEKPNWNDIKIDSPAECDTVLHAKYAMLFIFNPLKLPFSHKHTHTIHHSHYPHKSTQTQKSYSHKNKQLLSQAAGGEANVLIMGKRMEFRRKISNFFVVANLLQILKILKTKKTNKHAKANTVCCPVYRLAGTTMRRGTPSDCHTDSNNSTSGGNNQIQAQQQTQQSSQPTTVAAAAAAAAQQTQSQQPQQPSQPPQQQSSNTQITTHPTYAEDDSSCDSHFLGKFFWERDWERVKKDSYTYWAYAGMKEKKCQRRHRSQPSFWLDSLFQYTHHFITIHTTFVLFCSVWFLSHTFGIFVSRFLFVLFMNFAFVDVYCVSFRQLFGFCWIVVLFQIVLHWLLFLPFAVRLSAVLWSFDFVWLTELIVKSCTFGADCVYIWKQRNPMIKRHNFVYSFWLFLFFFGGSLLSPTEYLWTLTTFKRNVIFSLLFGLPFSCFRFFCWFVWFFLLQRLHAIWYDMFDIWMDLRNVKLTINRKALI